MKIVQKTKKGFTLIEMLVVIAIIALLAAIIVPAVTGALARAQRLRLSAAGKGIYTQIFASAVDSVGSSQNVWALSTPESGTYATTSTAYFTWLMNDFPAGAEVMSQDFSVFNAPGMTSVNLIANFDANDNPWSVVTDLDETSNAGTPFLLTRNISETALQTWTTDTEVLTNIGTTFPQPYGDEAVIVVQCGGGTQVLTKPQDKVWARVNPNSDDNTIFNP